MPSPSVWARNAVFGALLTSPYAIIGALAGLVAPPVLLATIAAGACGGLLYTGLNRLRGSGTLGYYAAWVLAVTLVFGLFLIGLHILMRNGEEGSPLDLFKEPEGVVLFVAAGLGIGVFMGRWFRRMSRGDVR